MKTISIKNKNSGFTLIELLVSTAIFTMVMLAAIGALLITSNSAKQAKALRYAMDNVNYAMDTMSRNLRLGADFDCSTFGGVSTLPTGVTQDCTPPAYGSAVAFTSPDDTVGSTGTGYQLFQNITTNNTSIQKCTTNGGCVDITSPDINITDLRFVVRGSGAGASQDFTQPSVLIMIKGEVTIKGKVTKFALQTLASQRNFE